MRFAHVRFTQSHVRRTLVAVSLAASTILGSHRAGAQVTPAAFVRNLLADRSAVLREDGLRLVRNYFTDRLDDGDYQNLTVRLYANVRYTITGVCDADCDDLDLRLFDDDGLEVAWDLDPDDRPVITVTPARTQTYTLRVIMASCGVDPCWFGVGVYSR